jgi:hypothetical protein
MKVVVDGRLPSADVKERMEGLLADGREKNYCELRGNKKMRWGQWFGY